MSLFDGVVSLFLMDFWLLDAILGVSLVAGSIVSCVWVTIGGCGGVSCVGVTVSGGGVGNDDTSFVSYFSSKRWTTFRKLLVKYIILLDSFQTIEAWP